MKSFLQHISEEYGGDFLEMFLEEAGNATNDAKGKRAEITGGKTIAEVATHPSNAGGTLADFRSPEGYDKKTGRKSKVKSGSPEEVNKKLEAKLGAEQTSIVDRNTRHAMGKFLDYAKRRGIVRPGHEIHQVAWTSLPDRENAPGDHERMTGVKDVTATGDIMFSTRNKKTKKITGHHAISMKYGTQSPNLSNPGLESLEKISNSKPGELTAHYQDHIERMGKPARAGGLAYSGSGVARHAQYKVDSMSTIEEAQKAHDHLQAKVDAGEKLDSNHKQRLQELKTHLTTYKKLRSKAAKQQYLASRAERADNAEKSALATRYAMIGTMLENLSKKGVKNKAPVTPREQAANAKGDQHLRKLLTNSISPPSATPHTIVHIIPNKDPNKDPTVHIHSREEHAARHLDQFEHLHAVQQGSTMVIKGRHKVTGRVVPVATYGIKNSDGPHLGFNGSLNLSNEVHGE